MKRSPALTAGLRLRISGGPAPAIREIPEKELEGDNRDKALEVPEGVIAYGATMWPPELGGSESRIKLSSGSVDTGDIRLRKSRLRNLSALLGPCEESPSIEVTPTRADLGPL